MPRLPRAPFPIPMAPLPPFLHNYPNFQVYAALMVLVYPIGIPVTFAYLLLKRKDKINPPIESAVASAAAADPPVAPCKASTKMSSTSSRSIEQTWSSTSVADGGSKPTVVMMGAPGRCESAKVRQGRSSTDGVDSYRRGEACDGAGVSAVDAGTERKTVSLRLG